MTQISRTAVVQDSQKSITHPRFSTYNDPLLQNQTPMKLAARLSREFGLTAQTRGQICYWQRQVHIQRGSDDRVEARVGGIDRSRVRIGWVKGVLTLWCNCSYFDSTGPCKHLWATVLAADARGYLSAATSHGEFTVECADLDDGLGYEGPFDSGSAGPAARLLPERARPFLVSLPGAVLNPPPSPPAWKQRISTIGSRQSQARSGEVWPAKRQLVYLVRASNPENQLVLSFGVRERKLDGSYGRTTSPILKRSQISHLPLPDDREILAAVGGGVHYYEWGGYTVGDQLSESYTLSEPLAAQIMPRVLATGRCYLLQKTLAGEYTPLVWDCGTPWRFRLEMRRGERGKWVVAGVLHREAEDLDLDVPELIASSLVIMGNRVAPLAADTPGEWLAHFRTHGEIAAPDKDREDLLATLLCAAGAPPLAVPEELRYEEIAFLPRPHLHIHAQEHAPSTPAGNGRLQAELSFDYDGRLIPAAELSGGFYDSEARRFLRRDAAAEQSARDLLQELGLKLAYGTCQPPSVWELAPTKLPRMVRALVEAGWHIEAEGKIFRRPGAFRMEVSTGVDWFELHGGVEYGETSAKLPELLEALRRGDNMVRLDDGTYGVLPEEWLRRYGVLARLGTPADGHVRFRPTQAGLLDALLATQPQFTCDEAFNRLREELHSFQGVGAALQPEGFVGVLRDYQREGLGWMEFLRRFCFGGCLADDMGVGKTAQVLALLETRRAARASGQPLKPSLVVVPKSLIFNWKQEAERFTPQLQVLDYTGVTRADAAFEGCDVVLTTYGTLRRDAVRLKDTEFDYIVLDEAQAIKNAGTEAAKAVRLLRGSYRLALSGTPVENHLGELWSLFEFLNPGMLGAASVFKLAGGVARNPDEDTRQLLAHALRPFILRRTKEQVARELPPKVEQTIYCEMEAAQRRLYNELRQHYRDVLLKRIDLEGLEKSKIQVLEALLRLRQASCHPGLIDVKRSREPSAKLDVLLEQLREVTDEGHKALVFSQFVSLLTIVRERLQAEGIAYEYLDGSTHDRQAPVERFQNDPTCRLFLISLKAGGLGLNLTAAEYVFLLDPWWNPAVEAQAMDRAHRIGQTRQVFAYRLIARDTVEEKVLELQKGKRDLAAAIIGEDNSLIRNLAREDLELLLS